MTFNERIVKVRELENGFTEQDFQEMKNLIDGQILESILIAHPCKPRKFTHRKPIIKNNAVYVRCSNSLYKIVKAKKDMFGNLVYHTAYTLVVF